MAEYSKKVAERTMGLDWGDKYSHYCVLDGEGEEIETGRVATRAGAMEEKLRSMGKTRVVMETGTHSPWVSLNPPPKAALDLGMGILDLAPPILAPGCQFRGASPS